MKIVLDVKDLPEKIEFLNSFNKTVKEIENVLKNRFSAWEMTLAGIKPQYINEGGTIFIQLSNLAKTNIICENWNSGLSELRRLACEAEAIASKLGLLFSLKEDGAI